MQLSRVGLLILPTAGIDANPNASEVMRYNPRLRFGFVSNVLFSAA